MKSMLLSTRPPLNVMHTRLLWTTVISQNPSARKIHSSYLSNLFLTPPQVHQWSYLPRHTRSQEITRRGHYQSRCVPGRYGPLNYLLTYKQMYHSTTMVSGMFCFYFIPCFEGKGRLSQRLECYISRRWNRRTLQETDWNDSTMPWWSYQDLQTRCIVPWHWQGYVSIFSSTSYTGVYTSPASLLRAQMDAPSCGLTRVTASMTCSIPLRTSRTMQRVKQSGPWSLEWCGSS